MKIVIVCPDVPPNPNGGLGTYLEGLIDALSDVDADIHVVGTSRDRKLPSMSLIGNVKIHRVLSSRPWNNAGTVRRLVGLAWEYLRLNGAGMREALKPGRQADVVAVHDWMCSPAGFMLRLLGKPTVYHIHSAEIYLEGGRQGIVSLIGRGLNRIMCWAASAIVVPTTRTVSLVPPIRKRRGVHVIPHGAGKAGMIIDSAAVDYMSSKNRVYSECFLKENRPIVLYLGRLAHHKGILELLEAIRILRDNSLDLYLIIVGCGLPDASMDSKLKKHAVSLDLGDTVHFTGCFLQTDVMIQYMAVADVCAFPSKDEGFGFGALEAMAVGCRVLVGPGYSPDVVASDAGTCIRVTDSVPRHLAEGIESALDKNYMPEMSQKAKEFVADKRNWKLTGVQTLGLYHKVGNAGKIDD